MEIGNGDTPQEPDGLQQPDIPVDDPDQGPTGSVVDDNAVREALPGSDAPPAELPTTLIRPGDWDGITAMDGLAAQLRDRQAPDAQPEADIAEELAGADLPSPEPQPGPVSQLPEAVPPVVPIEEDDQPAADEVTLRRGAAPDDDEGDDSNEGPALTDRLGTYGNYDFAPLNQPPQEQAILSSEHRQLFAELARAEHEEVEDITGRRHPHSEDDQELKRKVPLIERTLKVVGNEDWLIFDFPDDVMFRVGAKLSVREDRVLRGLKVAGLGDAKLLVGFTDEVFTDDRPPTPYQSNKYAIQITTNEAQKPPGRGPLYQYTQLTAPPELSLRGVPVEYARLVMVDISRTVFDHSVDAQVRNVYGRLADAYPQATAEILNAILEHALHFANRANRRQQRIDTHRGHGLRDIRDDLSLTRSWTRSNQAAGRRLIAYEGVD